MPGGTGESWLRRVVAVLCVALLCAATFVALETIENRDAGASDSPPAKPNIVLIVSDDQSLDSLAAMPFLSSKPGGHWFEFTRAFDNTPLCCPSRATLFSGLYPHHHGVEINSGGAFADASTIATWLQAAGYRTGLAGKYLNDYPFGESPFIPLGWSDWFANVGTSGHYDYNMNDNGTTVHYGTAESDYHTDVVARRAEAFIEASAGQPFFLYAAPIAPHPPLVPPVRYQKTRVTTTRPPNFNEADVSDKPAWIKNTPLLTTQQAAGEDANRAKQYRMVMAVDDLVRTVRQALVDTSQLENTVIMFLTDNGVLFGEHRRNGKSCVYEECVRTPLFMRVPWLEGRIDGHLISTVDIAPTVAELAGIAPADPVDGTSLVPLLSDPTTPWRSSVLLEHHAGVAGKPDFWAVRTETWKYAELATSERELYDVVNDPYELENVADSPTHETIQAALAQELAALRTASPHQVIPRVSIVDAAVHEGNDGTMLLDFMLSLSVGSVEGASVRASTVDGTALSSSDYAATAETVAFEAGETSKIFSVQINGDTEVEPDESFAVVLDQPVALEIESGTATGSILDDDDVPIVSIDDPTASEGDGDGSGIDFTITLSHASGDPAGVAFSTADGSAHAGEDYVATVGVVEFAPGVTEQVVSVDVVGDAVAEPDEMFTLELGNPVGLTLGDASGTATIMDDDFRPVASVDDVAVIEGDGGTTSATFTITLSPVPAKPTDVTWSTSDGSAVASEDYIAGSGTVGFVPGQATGTFAVAVVGDLRHEALETFSVGLTSADADLGDGEGEGTITDNDPAPAIAITDVVVTEGSGAPVPATFTVTLSGPSGLPVTVAWTTANGSAKTPGD
ncbi:MAG: sulfatase-like hydrolase/transferase, partial [Actinomycetota bacterium]